VTTSKSVEIFLETMSKRYFVLQPAYTLAQKIGIWNNNTILKNSNILMSTYVTVLVLPNAIRE